MINKKNVVVISLLFMGQIAIATPSGLNLQGRLVKDGVPISGSVTATIRVTSPDANRCILFEETYGFTVAADSQGSFSIPIGAGTRTGNDEGMTLADVFSNTASVINGLQCPGGGNSYTPLSPHTRHVYLSFLTTVGSVSFNDPFNVQSVPYALEATNLAGKPSSSYLQVIPALETTPGTTQTRLSRLIQSDYSVVDALIGGTSTLYMTTSNSGPTKLPVLTTTPASPAAGQIWYQSGKLKYYDGSSSQVKDVLINGGQSGALSMGTSDANALSFNTNNVARMSVMSSGRVGIGNTNPDSLLHIQGNQANIIFESNQPATSAGGVFAFNHSRMSAGAKSKSLSGDEILSILARGYGDTGFGSAAAYIKVVASQDFSDTARGSSIIFGTSLTNTSAAVTRMSLSNGGNLGIGAAPTIEKLNVAGEVRVQDCVKNSSGTQIAGACVSDERFKRDIEPAETDMLSKIKSLKLVTYFWRKDEFPEKGFGKQQELGFIAQQVQKVAPDLVQKDDEGYYRVKFHRLPMILVGAIQELAESKVDKNEYELKIQALENQNRELQKRIEKIERAL